MRHACRQPMPVGRPLNENDNDTMRNIVSRMSALDKVCAETQALSQDELLILGVELNDRALTPESESDESVSKAWDVEIERRVKEIQEGRAKLVSLEDVLSKVNSRFGWDK